MFELDLSDSAHRPEKLRMVRPAHSDPHPPSAPRQLAHDIAPYKAGPAKDYSQFSRHVTRLLRVCLTRAADAI
ncbi:MAG: hypothetical protein DHS20C04_30630 [Hyphococcus sp.]|nr:MAG: hypothetical protein DHS20C04_30630 [Marinicaulis sp.]